MIDMNAAPGNEPHFEVIPSKLHVLDMLREAMLTAVSHPARAMITVIGTVLGSAAFVATLGLSSTLSQQVSSSFDSRRATEVVVQRDSETPDVRPVLAPEWLDDAALDRLEGLNGVVVAGRRATLGEQPVRRTVDFRRPAVGVPVMGADPSALQVIAPKLTSGRFYDSFHEEQNVNVALLSVSAAQKLGVHRTGVAIFIRNHAYTVIGIYDDVSRRLEAITSVIVPYSVASRLAGDGSSQPSTRDILIETEPGAAQLIGRQAPLALRPEAPEDLRAIAPPDPKTLRREIEDSITSSTLIISVVAFLIGTASIGNAATAAISSRSGEIGLRRAVGARRHHIFVQLVLETAMLGGLGGVLGAAVGIVTTSAVSLWNGWSPVLETGAAVLVVASSTIAGLLAGLAPAARAARIPPVKALQR